MRAQLLVTPKTPRRAPSTRALLCEFKSTHTEASLVVVGSLVVCFEACASQQTFHSNGLRAICCGLSRWSKELPRVFGCVLACLPSECVTARLKHLIELRRSQLVPRVPVILVIVSFEAEAPLLVKVPLTSFPHHFKKDHPIL